MVKRDNRITMDFLRYEIKLTDDKMQKARQNLRKFYEKKQQLLSELKTLEEKQSYNEEKMLLHSN